jgi:hypothetical protein
MRSVITTSAAIAISIVLAAALSACAPPPPSASSAPTSTPSWQTVSAACEALEGELEEIKKEMSQAAEVLNTNTAAAAELLGVSAFRLSYMAEEELENEEVIQVATKVSESLTALSELLRTAAPDTANADSAAINAAGDDVNAAFAAFNEVCPTSGDSVGASCDALEGTAAGVNAQLSVASELLSSDPTTGAGMLAEAATGFETAASAVENEEVGALAAAMSDRLNEFSELINALAADPANPDEEVLAAGSAALNAAFSELASFCDW